MLNNLSFDIHNFKNRVFNGWNGFWFSPIDLYGVGLFRLLFGITLLLMYAMRAQEFSHFFLESGVMPYEWAQKILPEGYQSPRPFYLESDMAMQIQGVAHYLLLILFASGLIGRNLTWLLFILNLGFLQRNMTVIYGADLFANFWLFYLSFVNHNKYFSVLQLFRKNNVKLSLPEPVTDLFSSVGIRLIQIQLCLAYTYTGLEKLKGYQWWEGTAVWYVVGLEDMMTHNFAFLMNFPVLVAVSTFLTLIFEIYFIFAIWNKTLRGYWLFVGFLFHLGTAIFMNLWFFFLVMITAYIVFLDTRQLRFFIHNIRQKLPFLQVR